MEMHTTTSHTARMDKEQYEELFELAVDMAYQAFEAVTDDHVQGVYERLIWNASVGLEAHGAVTVH